MDEQQVESEVARLMQQRAQLQDSIIRYQLDNNAEIELLRMELLGQEYDAEGNVVQGLERMQLINKAGVGTMMSILRPRTSKMISLSNFDKFEIMNRCHVFADELTFFLGRHHHEFTIPSLQSMSMLIDLTDDVFFATMNKALDAGDRDTLRKQFQHIETSETLTENRPKMSPLPSFNLPFGGTQGGRPR